MNDKVKHILAGLLIALEVYAAEALNVTEVHKAAVMALDTIDAVEGYDITAGYPQQLILKPQWLESKGRDNDEG